MSKKITPITHTEWVKELFPIYSSIPPDGVTAKDVVKETGMKEGTVRCKLLEKVNAGELCIGKTIIDGKVTNFYYPAKK